MVIGALGIASYVTVIRFCDDVIWGALRVGESWQVASELMLVYLKLLDADATRTLHLGNLFRRGGQDTLLVEARRNAATFFRPFGGNPTDQGPPTPTAEQDPKIKSSGASAPVDSEDEQVYYDAGSAHEYPAH